MSVHLCNVYLAIQSPRTLQKCFHYCNKNFNVTAHCQSISNPSTTKKKKNTEKVQVTWAEKIQVYLIPLDQNLYFDSLFYMKIKTIPSKCMSS